MDHVCDIWTMKDEGIWEVRGGPRHFVYSKLMCWVAVDRGIKMSGNRKGGFDRTEGEETRKKIKTFILTL